MLDMNGAQFVRVPESARVSARLGTLSLVLFSFLSLSHTMVCLAQFVGQATISCNCWPTCVAASTSGYLAPTRLRLRLDWAHWSLEYFSARRHGGCKLFFHARLRDVGSFDFPNTFFVRAFSFFLSAQRNDFAVKSSCSEEVLSYYASCVLSVSYSHLRPYFEQVNRSRHKILEHRLRSQLVMRFISILDTIRC